MKTQEETVAFILRSIGYVYQDRPLRYGGSGAGVELYLLDHHEIWSFIMDREDDLKNAYWDQLASEDCGSANFSTRYAMNHPAADEIEIASYVVEQSRKISDRLEMPIPHDEIKQELARDGVS